MARIPYLVSVLIAIDGHHVAGIVVAVVGGLVAIYGVLRGIKRVSGAALIALFGVAVAVVGVLVFTQTIKG